jgi:hypothetical protein
MIYIKNEQELSPHFIRATYLTADEADYAD